MSKCQVGSEAAARCGRVLTAVDVDGRSSSMKAGAVSADEEAGAAVCRLTEVRSARQAQTQGRSTGKRHQA